MLMSFSNDINKRKHVDWRRFVSVMNTVIHYRPILCL